MRTTAVRSMIVAAAICCLETAAFALTVDEPPFSPVTPEVSAQGGSFTAIAGGYNSLLTNPAGFAREGGVMTALSATATSYFLPTSGNLKAFERLMQGDPEGSDQLGGLIRDNGIGGAGSLGIGYVGHNLGLGVVGDVDAFGRGDPVHDAEADLLYTWGFIGGLALPLHPGPVDLYVGGDLRYMVRSRTTMGLVELFEGGKGSEDLTVLSGGGLALDGGVIAEYGAFALGVSMRDIGGTRFDYTESTVGEPSQIFTYRGAEGGDQVPQTHIIPMSASAGLAYHPDMGELTWLLDPKIHGEYRYVWYAGESEHSPRSRVHLGAELRSLGFLKLRAGLNQGHLTAGVGARLLFLDLNLSYYTRETSYDGRLKSNEAVSLEAAIRF